MSKKYVVFVLYASNWKVKGYVDQIFKKSEGHINLLDLETKMIKKFRCNLFEIVDESQIEKFQIIRSSEGGIYKLDDNNIVSSL